MQLLMPEFAGVHSNEQLQQQSFVRGSLDCTCPLLLSVEASGHAEALEFTSLPCKRCL